MTTEDQLAEVENQLDELVEAIERARQANLDAYGRNPVEVILGAAEGPNGDLFAGFRDADRAPTWDQP